MADPNFQFDPVTGHNDTEEFLTNPPKEAVRGYMQRLHDQTRDFINNTLITWIKATFLTPTGDFRGTINGGDVTLTEPGLSGAFNAHKADKTHKVNITNAPYNAVGDDTVDNTAAIQAALDYVGTQGMGVVFVPKGTYKITQKLLWNHNDVIIEGVGDALSIIHFAGTGTAIESSNKATGERFRCGFKNLKLASDDNTLNTPVVDMQGCRNFGVKKFWLAGGGTNCDLIKIKGILGTSDATYNRFDNCYMGLAKNGIISEEVANNNIFDNIRIQVPGTAHWFKGGTYSPNSNQIVGGSCEYAGGIGVKVEIGCEGIEVLSTRFESMTDAIIIDTGTVNCSVIAPYFSSNTRNFTYKGTTYADAQLFKGILIKGGTKVGFDKALLTAYLNPVDVPDGGDDYFFDSQSVYHKFRSFRTQGGLGFDYGDAGAYRNGIKMTATNATAQILAWNGNVIQWGTGSPEGVVSAYVGSLYLRLDGGASTTLYVKQSGTGNTGWAAK
jgi:hypothetical protein